MKQSRFVISVLLAAPTLLVFVTLSITPGETTRVLRAGPLGSASPSIPSARVTRYQIDPGQSRFTVRAFVGGLLSGFGHNHTIAIRDFSGEVQFSPDNNLESASLQMRIRADSLAVIDKVSDKDRQEIEHKMRDEVLETGKYPDIVFRSTSVSARKAGDGQYQIAIQADLQLHGVTRHGQIQAQLTLSGNTLRARGEFPLRQTDYKIKPPSVAAGTIKVKDELRFSFDIVARQ